MKKTKILMPLMGIAALGTVVAPMVALTSCSKTKILTYDEAKEWVKTNYGEASQDYKLTKAESSWAFSGWINFFGKAADVGQNTGWLYNHLDNFLASISYETKENVKKTAYDRDGATDSTKETGKCMLGDIAYSSQLLNEKGVVVETEATLQTLSFANFEEYMQYYFNGAFKYNADYIVNGKEMIVHGTLSYYQVDASSPTNYDNLKLPNCYIAFDSKGRLTSVKFDFEELTTCLYSYKNASSDYGYTFMLLPGSYVNAKYSFDESK